MAQGHHTSDHPPQMANFSNSPKCFGNSHVSRFHLLFNTGLPRTGGPCCALAVAETTQVRFADSPPRITLKVVLKGCSVLFLTCLTTGKKALSTPFGRRILWADRPSFDILKFPHIQLHWFEHCSKSYDFLSNKMDSVVDVGATNGRSAAAVIFATCRIDNSLGFCL